MVKRYEDYYVTKGAVGKEMEVWGHYDNFLDALRHTLTATVPCHIIAWDNKERKTVTVLRIDADLQIKRLGDLIW